MERKCKNNITAIFGSRKNSPGKGNLEAFTNMTIGFSFDLKIFDSNAQDKIIEVTISLEALSSRKLDYYV